MRPEDHVRRLLLQSDRTPAGQLERALLQSAVDLADALGDDLLGYEARMRLSAWAAASGDSTTRLRAFDRCLELHLGDPLRYPATTGDLDLLWDFASIPRLLVASPRYDRETIAGCLDEMLEVFSFQGADLRAFDFARFEVAAAMGDEALAAESLARVTGGLAPGPAPAARAEPLVCEACVFSAEIAWHAEHGHLDRAAAAADRLRASGAGCAVEPELGMSRALVPFLLTGRLSEARDLHLEGYERVRHNSCHLEAVAGHVAFAVMVGSVHRALALVERHARWLVADPLAGSAQLAFLGAAGGAMDALTRSGSGSTVVVPADSQKLAAHLGTRIGAWTATTFAKACWAAAEAHATAFDARNANDHVTRRLAAARAVRPVTVWEPAVWGRDSLSQIAPGSGGGRQSRPAAIGAASSLPRAQQRLTEPRVLLGLAREHAAVGDQEGAESIIDDALPRADPVTRSELFALRIRMHVDRDEISAAEQQLQQRIDCLIVDDLGDDAEIDRRLGLLLFGAPLGRSEVDLHRELARARESGLSEAPCLRITVALATSFFQQGRYAEAAELLAAAVGGVAGARRSAALFLLADAYFALGRAQDAVATIAQLLEHPIDRALRASALLRRASVVFTLDSAEVAGGVERAVDDADRALQFFSEIDHCEGILDACGVLGHLLGRIGSVEGSLEALRTALDTARRFDHPDVDTMTFRLACALVRADRGEQARRLLDEVVEHAPAGGDPSIRGEVYYWLGHACRADDDDPAAYCVWSLALEEFARLGDQHASARAGIALGRLLLDNDDPSAVPALNEAVRRARAALRDEAVAGPTHAAQTTGLGVPAATLIVDSLHLLGRAQAAFGDPAGLRTLDETVAEAVALDRFESPLEASIVESRARALDDLDREGEAAASARQAAALYDAVGDLAAAARVSVFGARLLARVGDTEHADVLYEASLARYDAAEDSGRSTPESRIERTAAAREHESLRRVIASAEPTEAQPRGATAPENPAPARSAAVR